VLWEIFFQGRERWNERYVGWMRLISRHGRVKACMNVGHGLGNKQADFGLCFRVQEFSRRLAPMPLMRRDFTTGCVLSAVGLDF
jgi:hypothetical protein